MAVGEDGVARCSWAGEDEDYRRYHDEEWGRPVGSDRALFELLSLEGFQAGLSWLTILRKREAFRRAFLDFEPEQVARFGPADVDRLLGDAGIVRHRGKIEAVIGNARHALDLPGGLGPLVWRFEASAHTGGDPDGPGRTTSPEATALSRELKRAGWRFVGPTTVHAFLQAAGLVDDHVEGCHAGPSVKADRQRFVRPTGGTDSGDAMTRRAGEQKSSSIDGAR